jgi:hypothetical protein
VSCSTTTHRADASAPAIDGPQVGATGEMDALSTAAATGATPTPDAEDASSQTSKVSGSLSTRLRARRNGDESDHDLFTVLEVRVGDRETDDFTGYVLGRAGKDLDGGDSSSSSFSSLEDTQGKSLDFQLYEAYADYNGADEFQTVRVGRQWLVETPATVNLDGVLVETEDDAVLGGRLGVYGGLPYHEYESSARGDSVMGAYLTAKPWKGSRLRIDGMKVDDEQGDVTRRNELYAISLHQNVLESTTLRGRYSWLDNESRDAELAATYRDVESETLVQATYREQLSTQGSLVNEFDPFSAVIQDFEPYTQRRVLVSKGFDGDFTLEAGADQRRLSSSDESQFNREFDRWHATGTVHDLASVDGLSASLTADLWDSDGSDTDTWGLDLSREFSRDLSASVGSYYALYKNDFLLDEERERVRTWFARTRWRIDPSKTLALAAEYESADLDHFSTLTARMTWRF